MNGEVPIHTMPTSDRLMVQITDMHQKWHIAVSVYREEDEQTNKAEMEILMTN